MQIEQHLTDSLRRHAALRPSADALYFEGRQSSFQQLDQAADRTASALIRAGISVGDRICYWGKNSDAFVELLFASMRAGCALVPLNWRLTISEAGEIIKDAGAKMLFADGYKSADAEALSKVTPGLDHLIAIRSPESDLADYDAWRDAADLIEQPAVSRFDAYMQIYTSGTTGRPKGVLMTPERYGAHLARMNDTGIPWFSYSPDDIALVAMPFFHLSGVCPLMDAFHAGASVVLLKEFSADLVAQAIVSHQITRTFIVPAALRALLDQISLSNSAQSKLRYVVYGASPIDPGLLKRAMATLGCEFVHFYGMTEALNSITGLAPDDHRLELGDRWKSVGLPLPGMSIRIADPNDAELPPEHSGEIQLKAPFLASGYWGKPEDFAASYTADGWFKTGDAGRRDPDGYLYVEDRIKDMIISGGENIFPLEIEAVLNAHSTVAESAVVGTPDPKWGERVVAFVVAETDATSNAEELSAWVRKHLASYKCPKDIIAIDQIPRNAAGKMLKRELRSLLAQPSTNQQKVAS